MPFRLVRRILIATFAVGLVPLTGTAAFGSTKPTVSSVLKAAKRAVVSEKSVHIVVSSISGTTKNHVRADLGVSSGQEYFTSGNAAISIVVTPKYVYLSGNAKGLENLIGLTSAQQKKVGTKVIVIKAGTSPYASFQSNLTVVAFASFLPTSTGVSLGRDRHGNYVLSWSKAATSSTAKTTSVLTISKGHQALPMSEVVKGGGGGGTTTFTRWGKSFSVTIHKHANTIAYTSVVTG